MKAVKLPQHEEGHRHFAGLLREHEFEPVPGLPEPLPPGERLLWQGAPDWRMLAVHAFHVRKLLLYFAVLVSLRLAFVIGDGADGLQMLRSLNPLLPLAAVAIGLTLLLAWLSARATLYTITDQRVVMRIGIVLTLTFNLPFKRIAAAAFLPVGSARARNAPAQAALQDPAPAPAVWPAAQSPTIDFGNISLQLAEGDRIAWLNLWPHARPWRLDRPEPTLRCIADAQAVSHILAQAWSARTGIALPAVPPAAARPAASALAAPGQAQRGAPALDLA